MKAIKQPPAAVSLAMIAIVVVGELRSLPATAQSRAEAVADTNGNLHVPDDIEPTY